VTVSVFNITPTPKPRQTRADKWKKRPCVLRYRAFADEVRLRIPRWLDLNSKTVVFYIPMPKSWSEKKKNKMLHKPHETRPDIDNLAKALFDALYSDDSHIHNIRLIKVWADKGAIKIDG